MIIEAKELLSCLIPCLLITHTRKFKSHWPPPPPERISLEISERREFYDVLTTIIAVINSRILFSSIERKCSDCFILIVFVLCIIVDPLRCRNRPFDHLTFIWSVSQEEKREFSRQDDRFFFVTVCSTAKSNLCVTIAFIEATRKRSTFCVRVWRVFIIPVYCTIFLQIFRAIALFINTVLTWREYKKYNLDT